MGASLRPVHADDREFLFKVYAGTRLAELAPFGWSPEQQEAFLRMQFNAQQRWYATAYPNSQEQIVMLGEMPIGRMIVSRQAGTATLVDISLLPEHRGSGIGGGLLRDLIEQCGKEGVVLRLQVLKSNPAARLYERLGFRQTGADDLYWQMEKLPA
jgi:ribosomal protein S18 acetylase RimI-like enzyme